MIKYLSDFNAIIQSALVRGDIDFPNTSVINGIGKEGDFVLCKTISPKNIMNKEGEILYTMPGTYFIGALGNRESSVHASGFVPYEGIKIADNITLSFLGGSSGIIGQCISSPSKDNNYEGQIAEYISCVGLLSSNSGILNVKSFAITSKVNTISTPIILVGATAADVGKTTLCKRIISTLSQKYNFKVCAIKATGSGGLMDSLEHKNSGAKFTFDLVDCGMVSTYTSSEIFRNRILSVFYKCEELNPDIIVCELGGDIIWANNLTLLEMIPIRENIKSFYIICSDALSAIGTIGVLADMNLKEPFPIYLTSSPFKNYSSFAQRLNNRVSGNIFIQNYFTVEINFLID